MTLLDLIMIMHVRSREDHKDHHKHQADGVHLMQIGITKTNRINSIIHNNNPPILSIKKLKVNTKNKRKRGKIISKKNTDHNSIKENNKNGSNNRNKREEIEKTNKNKKSIRKINIIKINIIKDKMNKENNKEDIKNNNMNIKGKIRKSKKGIKERLSMRDSRMKIQIQTIKISIDNNLIRVGMITTNLRKTQENGRNTSKGNKRKIMKNIMIIIKKDREDGLSLINKVRRM